MKYLQVYVMLGLALLLTSLPVTASAEGSYGVGAEDYIVKHRTPDLLDDEGKEQDDTDIGISDPLEPLNRAMFAFNDKLYFWVLKPVKKGYTEVVPWDFRFVIGNFFNNLASPVDFANTLLQGRFKDSGVVLGRFLINTTIGVFGFGDIAGEEFDLQVERADFGQTLGVYGIGEGIYLCWPFFGPSDVRDSVGFVGDLFVHPYMYSGLDSEVTLGIRGEEFVNEMSISPDSYEELKRVSVDPYVASKQAYIDYRRSLIKSAHDK